MATEAQIRKQPHETTTEMPSPYRCGFCDSYFSSVNALYAHQQEAHDPDGLMFSELGLPK